jgi:hypothetical protein
MQALVVVFITLGTKFAIVYMKVVVDFSHVHTRLMILVMVMGFSFGWLRLKRKEP